MPHQVSGSICLENSIQFSVANRPLPSSSDSAIYYPSGFTLKAEDSCTCSRIYSLDNTRHPPLSDSQPKRHPSSLLLCLSDLLAKALGF